MYFVKAQNEHSQIVLAQLDPSIPEDADAMDTHDSFFYTIEKDEQLGGFNVLQCDHPNNRYAGKRLLTSVQSHDEGRLAIIKQIEQDQEFLKTIKRSPGIGSRSHTFHHPDERYEQ